MSGATVYEARPVQGGYRIWNRRVGQWWGTGVFLTHPTAILSELNGPCRATRIRTLVHAAQPRTRSPLLG